MKEKLKLTRIELTTDNEEVIVLTIAQAKELYDQLHDLFGQLIVFVPGQPYWIYRDYFAPYPRITWTSNTATVNCDSGISVGYVTEGE